MLTGVIYAAIVVAWAAYLVPLALRRHDEASRSRSIERFSSAMRVLSRRGTADAGRDILTPKRSTQRMVPPDRATRRTSQPADPAVIRKRRKAEAAAAARRRRVLAMLLSLLLATVGCAVFDLVPWWSVAIPAVAIVGFLVVARYTVRKASDAYWEAAIGTPEEEPTNVLRRTATRVDASHGVDKEPADHEQTVTLSQGEAVAPAVPAPAAAQQAAAQQAAAQQAVAIPVETSEGGSLWDPLPVTLPTYVDKPAARRTVRNIDLGTSDAYSSGHSEDATRVAEHGEQSDQQHQSPAEERQAASG